MILALAGGVLAAGPWPMFQNDVQHTGLSQFVGSQTNRIRCRFPLTGKQVGSPAIAADGTIYLPSGTLGFGPLQGFLYAVNPDCTQRWVYQLPGPPSSTAPAIAADGTIYVHANGGGGNIVAIENLTAINPDGSLKWQFEFNNGAGNFTSYVQSSPAIASDGTIYAGSIDTRLYAINPGGALKWRRTITASSITSSPVIAPDGTIYIVDPFDLAAFSPEGTLLWRRQLANSSISSNASPSIATDGTIYIGKGKELQAINSGGTLRWKFQTSGFEITSTPAIGTDGTIYVGEDGLYALRPDGTLKWKFPTTIVPFSSASPVIGADGTIYWRELFKAYAINPDGTQKWSMVVDPGSSSDLDPSAAIGAPGVLAWGDGGFTSPTTLMLISDRVQMSLSVNKPRFHGGEPLALSAIVVQGPAPVMVDIYVALQPPGCTSVTCLLFWQGEQGTLNFTSAPQPLVRNWPVGAFHGQVFSYTFAGNDLVGDYVWLGAFTEPGTGNIIGGVAQAPFTFGP